MNTETIVQVLTAPKEEIDILEDLFFERANILERDWYENNQDNKEKTV